jgi:CP12 domain
MLMMLLFQIATATALGVLLLLSVTVADAFVPQSRFGRARTAMLAVRPDTSALVEEALKISAAFGLDSKEAAAAWDIVEELDASDNRWVCVVCLFVVAFVAMIGGWVCVYSRECRMRWSLPDTCCFSLHISF